MARSSLKIVVDQKTPLTLSDASPKGGRQLLRKVIRHLEGILGGVVDASHIRISSDGAQPVAASGIVTAAAVAAAATITLNGTTLTAAEDRANCTVTCGTSIDAADTVTVNGVVFTAVAADAETDEFVVTGTAATDAAALVACINACTDPLVSGLIEAVRPAANGAVNIYAILPGTAGNSYTIETSDAVDLAITNDNSGAFAGGAATANNEFDAMGNNTRTATEIARCINASTTALVSKHCEASNWAGAVALSTCTAGTVISINGHQLRAVAVANSTPQANPGDFAISGTDTEDGDAFVAALKAHPVLSHDLVAINASGTVAIRQRRGTSSYGRITVTGTAGVAPSGATATQFAESAVVLISGLDPGQSSNAIALASSNGTTLAVSGARLAGGTGAESGTQVSIVIGGSAN
jgi:hypothetical protein